MARPRSLEVYRHKRDFARTPEPSDAPARGGLSKRGDRPLQYVIQMHDATRLHYDLRLELDGVLKCWAVPKGPSLDPAVKRLAVATEDHPVEYLSFEGVIPAGQYGGGPMLVWDRGLWFPDGDVRKGIADGHFSFRLEGEKLRGRWSLTRGGKDPKSWLLVKRKDDAARPEQEPIVAARPASVLTGRSIDEVLAAGPEATLRALRPAGDPRAIEGAVKGAMPDGDFVEPQLATLSARAPTGAGWLGEVKLDGYRLIAARRGAEVRLRTRSGQDWTARFPAVVGAIAALPAERCLLDGELVVFDRQGRTDFQALQAAIVDPSAPFVYVAFDLLHLDGWDLTGAALRARKEALHLLLAQRPSAALRYGDHVDGALAELLAHACELGLEGIVAKRGDAPYRSGRGKSWLKLKCLARQELVVVGFTEPKGGRGGLGALLLGVHEGERLRFAGKVGTGFSAAALVSLRARLDALARPGPACEAPPGKRLPKGRDVHWVEPTLVAEVSFTGWTADGILRHPSFQGLREDKPAGEVVREVASAPDAEAVAPSKARAPTQARPREATRVAGVRVTHPDKVMFPDLGITKLELARYYERVAPLILPHVRERPLSLVRCPDGVRGSCFYQKHAHAGVPSSIPRVDVRDEPGAPPYLMIDGLDALLGLVHFGVVELHVWGARADRLDRPDVVVLDLDPAPDVPWSRVATTAQRLRARVSELGLVPFLRTTGGKGLHVVVPLARRAGWDEVKALALGLAQELVREEPKRYTAKLAKDKRGGKVFIDYLRNAPHATAVAPWSVRARDGAPVALPLPWEALELKGRPAPVSLRGVIELLDAGMTDAWAGFDAARRPLTRPMLASLAAASE